MYLFTVVKSNVLRKELDTVYMLLRFRLSQSISSAMPPLSVYTINIPLFHFIFFIYSIDPVAFGPDEKFKKISITYDDHWFVICISNKKIYVVKRSIQSSPSESIAVNV